ncbi:MAG: hypothetical protein IJL21_04620 [Alphaproteobacteria bacterium]|nr:hypothetical protein [Alphaproteobacteria bacterium]
MSINPQIRRNLGGGDGLAAPNMTNKVRHIAHKFLYFSIFLIFIFPYFSFGVTLKQRSFGESTGGAYYSDYDYGALDYVPGADGMSEMEVVSTLRHDIQALDEQIATCERKRKGWVAATVVGGVGVAATGIAAIVQHNKIQDKKTELESVKKDVTDAKHQVEDARQDLDKLQPKKGN